MNRRISKLALAALAAIVVVAAGVGVAAQTPPAKGATVTAPIVLPPPVDQKPGQVAPAIQPPAPPQRPEPAQRERRYENSWNPGTTINVRFEATITDQMGTAAPVKKSISVTIADGGRASVRSGVTVPIVSASVPKEGSAQPYSSYTYRDMGLSLDIQNVFVDGNYIRASWGVEYNPVDEKVADSPTSGALMPGAPSFASFKQNLVLALESGKLLVASQSSDPVPARDRKMTLEVKATILK